ncbi:hypothetical protein F5B17DRAFT_385243 [Nemania serpens]|nr:hypothetical protein F5B17DRAFT_385243 [Nemania serpens]
MSPINSELAVYHFVSAILAVSPNAFVRRLSNKSLSRLSSLSLMLVYWFAMCHPR